jgi:hypothetical protein
MTWRDLTTGIQLRTAGHNRSKRMMKKARRQTARNLLNSVEKPQMKSKPHRSTALISAALLCLACLPLTVQAQQALSCATAYSGQTVYANAKTRYVVLTVDSQKMLVVKERYFNNRWHDVNTLTLSCK